MTGESGDGGSVWIRSKHVCIISVNTGDILVVDTIILTYSSQQHSSTV